MVLMIPRATAAMRRTPRVSPRVSPRRRRACSISKTNWNTPSARAESAERRAAAAEQRERAAFHERAAASADPGMPRPPRWLETGTGTGTGTGTKENEDAATATAREPPSSATVPAPERGSGVRLATRKRVTAADAHTQTETTLVLSKTEADARASAAEGGACVLDVTKPSERRDGTRNAERAPDSSLLVAASVARRPPAEAPRFGDASVADAPTDLARARRRGAAER
jgi:hypothetical protein